MENKTIFEGVVLNQPKLTDFGSTLLRVKNTRTYKKKDGSQGETTYTAVVSVEWRKLAEEVVNRFKQNDTVRVEGELKKKKTDKVDQNGDEIWETWIKALTVNALPNMQSVVEGIVQLERDAKKPMKSSGPVYQPTQLPQKPPYKQSMGLKNQPQSSFDSQPMPIPLEDPNQAFEEVFEGDLPF